MTVVADYCYCQISFCRQLSDSLETGSGSHCCSLLIKPIQLHCCAISCLLSYWDSADVFCSWLQTLLSKSNAHHRDWKTPVLNLERGKGREVIDRERQGVNCERERWRKGGRTETVSSCWCLQTLFIKLMTQSHAVWAGSKTLESSYSKYTPNQRTCCHCCVCHWGKFHGVKYVITLNRCTQVN